MLTPDGLAGVDIARPTDPQGISAHALSGRPESVTLDGDRAYVATSRGLYVLDMRTPSQPVAESFLTTAGYAEAVAAADGMLYVAAGEQGLQVFTHSADAPSDTPVGAATLRLDSGYAEAIALAGRYALVAAGSGGVQVIDMAEPTRPSAAASLSLPGYALDLVVAGDYAYVIDRYHGMAVVDIAQPAAPRQVGLLATPGFTHNVNVDDTRVLVATSPQGAVHLLDSADPTHTRQAGWTAMPDIAESATVSGRYAYIASGYSGLEVVDLAAADGPTRLAQLDALGYAHDVQTADGFAYVVAEGGLQVVDMRDPMHPREVGCTYTTNTVVDMALTGHTGVILGNSGHLQWIDLTHPTVPATVASIQLAGRPNAVAAADDYVYVAGAEGLRIIAIDAAGGVGEVGGYATPGPVNDVVAAGGYVYLALLDQGVQVLDLADPGHPVAVAGFDTPDQARRLAVAGDTLYVADHAGGLFILRLLPRPA